MVHLWCRIRNDAIDGACLTDMKKDDINPADFPSMKKVRHVVLVIIRGQFEK